MGRVKPPAKGGTEGTHERVWGGEGSRPSYGKNRQTEFAGYWMHLGMYSPPQQRERDGAREKQREGAKAQKGKRDLSDAIPPDNGSWAAP